MKSFLISLLIFSTSALFAQENYSTWSQHMTWYLHTMPNGANVPNNVVKFPVLLRLDSTNFNAGFSQAAAGGADLRFSKAGDVVHFPYQIESWNAAGKRASVWVLVDTVKGNTNNQVLRMHWGKTGAADSSNGKTVFDTANGFAAVFHLNEAGDTSTDTLKDATANGYKGVLLGTVADSVNPSPGNTIAGGLFKDFLGTGAYRIVTATGNNTNTALQIVAGRQATVSAWVKQTAWNANTARTGVVTKTVDGTGGASATAWLMRVAVNNRYDFTNDGPTSGQPSPIIGTNGDTTQFTLNMWTYLTYVRRSDDSAVFYGYNVLQPNGDSNAVNGATYPAPATNDTADVVIGGFAGVADAPATGLGFYNGKIDEVRISYAARSTSWDKLSYENQKPVQDLVSADTLTATSILPAGFAAAVGGAELRVSALQNGLLFQFEGTNAARARVSLVDMEGRTLWQQDVNLGKDSRIFWNGQNAPTGIYVAHVNLLDINGRSVQSLEREVPFLH